MSNPAAVTPTDAVLVPMTDGEYRQTVGQQCPYCRSSDIQSQGQFQSDSSQAWVLVTCTDCQKEWNEFYQLNAWSPS